MAAVGSAAAVAVETAAGAVVAASVAVRNAKLGGNRLGVPVPSRIVQDVGPHKSTSAFVINTRCAGCVSFPGS